MITRRARRRSRIQRKGGKSTHTDDGRIIGHWRRDILLGGSGGLLHAQILHVATPEDNELVDLRRAQDLFRRVRLAAFSAMRLDIFQRDGRLGGVDLDQGADVAVGGGSVKGSYGRWAAQGLREDFVPNIAL